MQAMSYPPQEQQHKS